ncbi:MAG: glycosyltransferase [Sutterellaceae bacterium]|nr:galactosyldiacylglycerol synthase [Burkholderiaceae bacterium]MCX7901596.1 galactosyldiacylglycerol synthase [Burkholderiaceae bacterium]MDW8429496.1 glycosyltransferase [Sutterellaceae bacterium]
MARIEIVTFNAGGGHQAAARALTAALAQRHPQWEVHVVNLFDLLDPQRHFRRFTGLAPEDLYNLRLRRGLTFGLAQELRLLQATVRASRALMTRRLQPYWQRTRPDLVVSLIPNFNRPLADSVQLALPGTPYVTVLTDLADHPPHFWIEPQTEQHVVCGTARAVEQARAQGVPAHRIHRVSGMLLHPSFYSPLPASTAEQRQALGLHPERVTAVISFGGYGAPAMRAIARALPDLQLVLLCGHNLALAQQLRSLRAQAARAVVGFTPDVRRYLQLADFFIGKPGPGSLSEAIHLGLPVITFCNAATMPQERYNTQWVREHGLGLVVPSVRRLRPAVEALLADLETYRKRVRSMRNNAVFEVVALLERLLSGSQRTLPANNSVLWRG